MIRTTVKPTYMLIRNGLSRLLLTTIVIVFLDGCVQPTDPAIPSTAIVSISEDSLFASDHFTVTVDHELKGDSVKLFIGPFKCPIDSVVGSKIHATAVAGDGENQVRVYVKDREATGDFVVYLFDRSLTTWVSKYVKYSPVEGMVGDTIMFTVDTAAVDPSSLDPRLNDVPLDFLMAKGKAAWYTIPAAVQDGAMQVRIFDRAASLYRFDVIRPETDLPFDEGLFQSAQITVGAMGHMLQLNPNGTSSLYLINPIQGGFGVHSNHTELKTSDSIRLDYDSTSELFSRYCYLRIHYDPQTRLLSGKIAGYRRGPEIEQDAYIESIEVEFNRLDWYKENGAYHLYSSENALSHISNLKYSFGFEDGPKDSLGSYERTYPAKPFVHIEIVP
jgi:hypothetical protein